jgi:hypothetical protein
MNELVRLSLRCAGAVRPLKKDVSFLGASHYRVEKKKEKPSRRGQWHVQSIDSMSRGLIFVRDSGATPTVHAHVQAVR